MDTKKINELTILEQATAETNVLVEQNGTASRIPASALGGGGGGADEKAIIEKLAPAFTKTAPVVTCNPVEGHPLEVVSHFQAGIVNYLADKYWTDEYTGDMAMLIEGAPAGEYTLYSETALDTELIVVAYDKETGEQTVIGTITSEDYGESGDMGVWSATLTFTHNGGDLLIRDDAWNCPLVTLEHDVGEWTSAKLTHNGKVLTAVFPQAVSKGFFNWSTGVLSVPKGNPNLIPDDLTGGKNWSSEGYDDAMAYRTPSLPSGQYTLYAEVSGTLDIQYFDGLDMNDFVTLATVEPGNPTATFTHPGGELRLVDVGWMVTEGGITQTPIKLEAGSEFTGVGNDTYQLTPHEILGLSGVNTLHSTTGNTEVSGRANPTAMFAEQEARIAALEAALLNG